MISINIILGNTLTYYNYNQFKKLTELTASSLTVIILTILNSIHCLSSEKRKCNLKYSNAEIDKARTKSNSSGVVTLKSILRRLSSPRGLTCQLPVHHLTCVLLSLSDSQIATIVDLTITHSLTADFKVLARIGVRRNGAAVNTPYDRYKNIRLSWHSQSVF